MGVDHVIMSHHAVAKNCFLDRIRLMKFNSFFSRVLFKSWEMIAQNLARQSREEQALFTNAVIAAVSSLRCWL